MATDVQPKTAARKKSSRSRRGAVIPLVGAPRRIGIDVETLKDAIRRGRLRAFPQDGRAFVEVEELDRFKVAFSEQRRRARESESDRDYVVPIPSTGKNRGIVAGLRLRLARVLRKRAGFLGTDFEANAPGDHTLKSHGHEGVERLRRALQGEKGVLTRKLESATRRRDFARERLRRWGG